MWTVGRHGGTMAGRHTYDREFDPWPVRGCAVTLGKLFTPTCFDADSLCYYTESLEAGCLHLYLWTVCVCYYMESLKPGAFTFTFTCGLFVNVRSGVPHSLQTEETRVWLKRDGKWQNIHIHRSRSK